MNLNANELRIGNLINYLLIDELDERKQWYYPSTVDIYNIPIILNKHKMNQDYQPIPLTEEWLLKLGFQSGGAKQWLFITLDEKDECYLYFNPLGKGIAIDQEGKECTFEIELNYVHQLQNLYFALTKKELVC